MKVRVRGCRVSRSYLGSVGQDTRLSTRSGGRVAVLSAAILAETHRSDCRCEDSDHMSSLYPQVKSYLYAGMPVSNLRLLGSGCNSTPWVCPRLDAVRRKVGL